MGAKAIPLATAVAFFVLFPGCIVSDDGTGASSAPEAWSRLDCDPGTADWIGGNAQLVSAFQGSALEVAQRVAVALGDPLQSKDPEHEYEDSTRWATKSGTITHILEPGVGPRFIYETERAWPGATESEADPAWRSFYGKLGASTSTSIHTGYHAYPSGALQGWSTQTIEGTGILESHGTFYYTVPSSHYPNGHSSVTIMPLFQPDVPMDALAPEEAVAIARMYHRCAMDEEGRTAAKGYTATSAEARTMWHVRHQSLAIGVHIVYTEPGEPGHCGFSRNVMVDAASGAVHGHETPGCD